MKKRRIIATISGVILLVLLFLFMDYCEKVNNARTGHFEEEREQYENYVMGREHDLSEEQLRKIHKFKDKHYIVVDFEKYGFNNLVIIDQRENREMELGRVYTISKSYIVNYYETNKRGFEYIMYALMTLVVFGWAWTISKE